MKFQIINLGNRKFITIDANQDKEVIIHNEIISNKFKKMEINQIS
jgi:hypothetical protein